MEFGDLFSFDKKIVPGIIKPIYWIGLFALPILGIISLKSPASGDSLLDAVDEAVGLQSKARKNADLRP